MQNALMARVMTPKCIILFKFDFKNAMGFRDLKGFIAPKEPVTSAAGFVSKVTRNMTGPRKIFHNNIR